MKLRILIMATLAVIVMACGGSPNDGQRQTVAETWNGGGQPKPSSSTPIVAIPETERFEMQLQVVKSNITAEDNSFAVGENIVIEVEVKLPTGWTPEGPVKTTEYFIIESFNPEKTQIFVRCAGVSYDLIPSQPPVPTISRNAVAPWGTTYTFIGVGDYFTYKGLSETVPGEHTFSMVGQYIVLATTSP